MSLSRREFLQRGTLLAAGAAVPFSRLNQDRGRGFNDEGISADVAPTRTGIGPVVPPAPEGAPPLHREETKQEPREVVTLGVGSRSRLIKKGDESAALLRLRGLLPVPPEVIVTKLWLVVAVQLHPACAVTLMLAVPPLFEKFWLVGLSAETQPAPDVKKGAILG